MAVYNDLEYILKYLFFLVFNLYHGTKMFKSKVPDIFGKNIQFLCILRSQFCIQATVRNNEQIFRKTWHSPNLILLQL